MTATIDVQALRAEFPFTEEWSYLNTASYGPFPQRTVRAMQAWTAGIGDAPNFFETDRIDVQAEAARMIADITNSDPEMIAWVPSLADGMNLLANGIDYRAGDNVLLLEGEYPSVVLPFRNLHRLGVEVRFVPRDTAGRADLNLIESAVDERTRALAISYVEYIDGYRNDIATLGTFCKQHGIELFVDATQALGVQPLDVPGTGVTAIVSHCFKWLMAGFGLGVVVFAPGAIDRLHVTYAGRLSVKAPFDDPEYNLDWRDGAARFQTGGLNEAGLNALHASLSLVTEVGPGRSAAHARDLLDRLAEGVTAAGYRVVSDLNPTHRSQIMTFTSDDQPLNDEIFRRLKQARVSVTQRPSGFRVAPYFYNTPDDIDRLLEVLPNR
jgi:selenocysteine lyase/cysteine desulfurase